jgi:hypothetical protein
MIAEAGGTDKHFDVILCLDTSRIARNATDSKTYKRLLRGTCNVRVEFVKMPTTDTYIDPLIETLMEGIDQSLAKIQVRYASGHEGKHIEWLPCRRDRSNRLLA